MQIKLLAIFAFVLLFLIILLIRIVYINVASGQSYAKQVRSQGNYDSRAIYSRRGEIQDTNGRVLAYSEKQYNLILDCKAVNYYKEYKSYEEYVDATVDALHDVFKMDKDEIRGLIQGDTTKESQYQCLRTDVTEEEKDAYEEYTSLDKDRDLTKEQRAKLEKVTGIWFEDRYVRRYPMDTVASTVVGFSNSAGDGVTGVEASYDELLKGTDGRVFGYLDESQEYRRRTIVPENGHTLRMTIDVNIQQVVEKYIAEFDEEYGDETDDGRAKHGATNVGVVVMNPNNGAILAMATNSGYDLNHPHDISAWYTQEEQDNMSDTEKVDAYTKMWSNFCVSSGYEPGSVVKPIHVAAALECGAVSTTDSFVCDGYEQVTDTRINCDAIYGHGVETLGEVIKNSCNDGLMAIGRKMGVSRFIDTQALFNYGKLTGIDLPLETTGIVYTRERMNEVELATCSFGQGFTCTMIQELAAFCSVVNGGYYYQPHVVSKVLDANGKVVKSMDGLLLKQTISSEVSDTLKEYLKVAVQEGTGRKSQVPGYLTGGKTGTAEKIDPETGQRWEGHYVVSFIGAAPINDPEIVMYVVVDDPNVESRADSTYAQVLFRKIATEILPYLNIYPTEEVSDEMLATLGLDREDISQDVKQTFDAFDTYGNYYKNAYVNEDNVVVTSDGVPIEGAYVREDGVVFDAYANQVAKLDSDTGEEKADNPDMAAPPGDGTVNPEDSSLWDPSVLPKDEE